MNFIEHFGGLTESYLFYNGQIELRFDPEDHVYLLVNPDGSLTPQDGITTICHKIDKSSALVPWGCKMMYEKLMRTLPFNDFLAMMDYDVVHKIVLESKSAHKEKLDEAADIGKQAHAWIESNIKVKLGRLDKPLQIPDNEKAGNCCKAALDWEAKHNVRWIETERKVYSRKYKYAGTMDGLALCDSCGNPLCCPEPFKNRLSLVDWKSSNYLYIEYLLQTAAYEQAYEEETGEVVNDRWIVRLGKEDGEFDPWHLEEPQFRDDITAFLHTLDMSRSLDLIGERMKQKKKVIAAAKKAEKAEAREAALQIKCKTSDKYKGFRPPKCNKGNPCQTCLDKYQKRLDTASSI